MSQPERRFSGPELVDALRSDDTTALAAMQRLADASTRTHVSAIRDCARGAPSELSKAAQDAVNAIQAHVHGQADGRVYDEEKLTMTLWALADDGWAAWTPERLMGKDAAGALLVRSRGGPMPATATLTPGPDLWLYTPREAEPTAPTAAKPTPPSTPTQVGCSDGMPNMLGWLWPFMLRRRRP